MDNIVIFSYNAFFSTVRFFGLENVIPSAADAWNDGWSLGTNSSKVGDCHIPKRYMRNDNCRRNFIYGFAKGVDINEKVVTDLLM